MFGNEKHEWAEKRRKRATGEIANVVHACFGRKPDVRSVERVLNEEPLPLRIVRDYPPYHETEDRTEGRAAIVELRLLGWSVKVIAGYLGVHHATVYRSMEKWKKGGMEGLLDRPFGRPPGVRKADFAAVEAIRKLAQNPGLGAFRVHAALEQMGFDLSRATCGRILAQVREAYGYEKPIAGGGPKKAMPFAASERHEVWSADVRHLDMVDEGLVGDKAYAITVMDNYSRAILASAVTRRQDLSAFFSERHSRVLDRLGYVTLMRWRLYGEEGLAGKEAELWLLENTLTVEHAGRSLSAYEIAYDADGGQAGSGRLLEVSKPTLFETPFAYSQLRLFGLSEGLGEDGWLRVLRLEDYADRKPRLPSMLQQALFPYYEAWG